MRTLQRDTSWKFDSASGQRARMRRVIVKARYVKFKGPQSRAGYAHLRYLQRDGASREGEPGKLYGRGLDVPRAGTFSTAVPMTHNQFRIIVAPEDGVALGHLKASPVSGRADGTRSGDPPGLGGGRSPQHQPSPHPYYHPGRHRRRQGSQHCRPTISPTASVTGPARS